MLLDDDIAPVQINDFPGVNVDYSMLIEALSKDFI
jgi:hypothetical protein